MAKTLVLVPVLLCIDHRLELNGELIELRCGQVYDLEPKDAKALVDAGIGCDKPANIAFHRGDIELYEKLIKESPKTGGKTAAKPTIPPTE